MRLEITPSYNQSLARLNRFISDNKTHLNANTPLNIITNKYFQDSLSAKFIVNSCITINNKPTKAIYNLYFQFDFIANITIDFAGSYISSLRFPRTLHHIKDWISGKRQDIVLSLIALNNNSVIAWNPISKQYTSSNFPQTLEPQTQRNRLNSIHKDNNIKEAWPNSANDSQYEITRKRKAHLLGAKTQPWWTEPDELEDSINDE